MHACACVWVFGGVLLGFFGCGERVWPIVFLVLQLFWGLGCGLGVRVLRVACCRVLGQCALGAWFLLILGPLLNYCLLWLWLLWWWWVWVWGVWVGWL